MASLMFTDCFASTTSRLIHSNRPNGAFFPSRCVGQLCLRTAAPGRVGQLCLRRTAASSRSCNFSVRSSSSDGAIVIDQGTVAGQIIDEIKIEVSRMKKSIGAVPGLAVIVVGDGNDSESYVLSCMFLRMESFVVRLAEDSSEEEVLESVSRLNDDPRVHGILVELPLPSHMDEHKILSAVSVEKDADGFHPLNIGRLAMQERKATFLPTPPKVCIELLHRYKLEIKGKKAVVVGSSTMFSMPAALLLQREDATVTIIHSRTENPQEITRQADIIISDIALPHMVRGSWIKPGAVIIDVGSSSLMDLNAPDGFRPLGDIGYQEVCKVAKAITPVDGAGSVFLTLTMILYNVLTSAKRFYSFI